MLHLILHVRRRELVLAPVTVGDPLLLFRVPRYFEQRLLVRAQLRLRGEVQWGWFLVRNLRWSGWKCPTRFQATGMNGSVLAAEARSETVPGLWAIHLGRLRHRSKGNSFKLFASLLRRPQKSEF